MAIIFQKTIDRTGNKWYNKEVEICSSKLPLNKSIGEEERDYKPEN